MSKPIAANDNRIFYVYVWRDGNGEPFYVGKGHGRRAYDVYDRSADFSEIHAGGGCSVEIVDWFIHEAQAFAHEIELIFQYGRRAHSGTLVNKTDGGDGCAGHIKSQEAIAKWREKNVGRKRDPEIGARISATKTGHTHTDETRAKLSLAHKKRFDDDPSLRDAQRQMMLNISDETRAKMGASAKRRMEDDPAERMRLADATRGKPVPQGRRAKISASMVGVPKSADTIANMQIAQRMKPPRGKYKGVSMDGDKWRAVISLNGKNKSLGYHSTPEDAALAYDGAAIAAWGIGGCYLNFPDHANDNEQQGLVAHVA